MLKIVSAGILALFIVGCGSNPTPVENVKQVIDPCEVDYQKCSAECQVSMLNEPKWKKVACETKCKTIYAGCKTKQKTIESYKYIKEKVTK